MKAPPQFKDEPGRAETLARKRVEVSSHAAWFVNIDSRIPVRWQLRAIRLWLWFSSLFA